MQSLSRPDLKSPGPGSLRAQSLLRVQIVDPPGRAKLLKSCGLSARLCDYCTVKDFSASPCNRGPRLPSCCGCSDGCHGTSGGPSCFQAGTTGKRGLSGCEDLKMPRGFDSWRRTSVRPKSDMHSSKVAQLILLPTTARLGLCFCRCKKGLQTVSRAGMSDALLVCKPRCMQPLRNGSRRCHLPARLRSEYADDKLYLELSLPVAGH